MKKFLCLLMLLAASMTASAETYLDLKNNETAEQILKRYPNSTFKQIEIVTLQEGEQSFEWVGIDPHAVVILAFIKLRPIILTATQNLKKRLVSANAGEKKLVAARIAELEQKLGQHENALLQLYSIKYVPKEPIDIEIIVKKYGKPDSEDITRSFTPVFIWKNGVKAFADPNGKQIVGISFDLGGEHGR